MPRHQKTDTEPPAKRAKLGNKGEFKFSSADEIRKALRTEDQSDLTEGARVTLILQGCLLDQFLKL